MKILSRTISLPRADAMIFGKPLDMIPEIKTGLESPSSPKIHGVSLEKRLARTLLKHGDGSLKSKFIISFVSRINFSNFSKSWTRMLSYLVLTLCGHDTIVTSNTVKIMRIF